jgi:hypothetical protein
LGHGWGKKLGWLGQIRVGVGFRPKAGKGIGNSFYFPNLLINYEFIWIQNKFKLQTTSTHKKNI